MLWKAIELGIVMGCCLAPMFVLANEVNEDEYAKAFSGIVATLTFTSLVAVYKVWKDHHNTSKN